MKTRSAQSLFLVLTSLIVLILGASAGFSFLRIPRKIDTRLAKLSGPQRAPTSLSSVSLGSESEKSASIGKSVSLTLPCDSSELGPTDVAHLRLLGELCDTSSKNVDLISIENQSNGFTAQIIQVKERSYTTDYIDLVEGKNLLVIKRKNQNGQVSEQRVQVNRRPAAIETQ